MLDSSISSVQSPSDWVSKAFHRTISCIYWVFPSCKRDLGHKDGCCPDHPEFPAIRSAVRNFTFS